MRHGQKLWAIGFAFGLVFLAGGVAAQDDGPTQIGRFGGWSAYTLPDGKRQVCYAVIQSGDHPATGKHGRANLMVTHRPAEKTFDVVSISLGTDLPPDTTAGVTVGKQKFDFFTKQQTAWSRDSDTDKAVVKAMAKADSLVITTKSAKGGDHTDTYTLSGFLQARDAIDKACKVKR